MRDPIYENLAVKGFFYYLFYAKPNLTELLNCEEVPNKLEFEKIVFEQMFVICLSIYMRSKLNYNNPNLMFIKF